MQRVYLEEDLGLIQKYFPGAKMVALRTPFDLTRHRSNLPRLMPDSFHDDTPTGNWNGDAIWAE